MCKNGVYWFINQQLCELSDQVSPSSHLLTAMGLFRDQVQTRLKCQLGLWTRLLFDVSFGFIWYIRRLASGPKMI